MGLKVSALRIFAKYTQSFVVYIYSAVYIFGYSPVGQGLTMTAMHALKSSKENDRQDPRGPLRIHNSRS